MGRAGEKEAKRRAGKQREGLNGAANGEQIENCEREE